MKEVIKIFIEVNVSGAHGNNLADFFTRSPVNDHKHSLLLFEPEPALNFFYTLH
jgi:hypothetical protein